MEQDFKKVRKFVRFMQEQGLLTLEMGDLKLSLHPSALTPKAPRAKTLTEIKAEQDALKPEFTPEQILMWSAPGYTAPQDEDAA